MSDSLNDRGKAIEDVFFNARDQDLIQKLKQEMAASEAREAMTLASGIDDDAVLDSLISCGITPESMASVALIPLVAVAWADNKMEDNEKEAILKAANEAGGCRRFGQFSIDRRVAGQSTRRFPYRSLEGLHDRPQRIN